MNSSKRWLVLDSGAGEAAFNMALDEALLEFVPQLGEPVLRFYGWTRPAASFGYFQKIGEIESSTHLRPLVRRPTGGGLVPHDGDWTYSLAIPPGHGWYELRAVESYERIHQWIQNAFASLGVVTELASCCRKEIPGQCFAGYERADVLWFGRKIAGAAQRRTKSGLLIQGSIQPQPQGVLRERFQRAMCETGPRASFASFVAFPPTEAIRARAGELVLKKYGAEFYNRRR
jgi:lipoate-protein ligase A